jgi:hypothetical protein
MSTDDLMTLVGFLRIVIGLAIISAVAWFASRRRWHGRHEPDQATAMAPASPASQGPRACPPAREATP